MLLGANSSRAEHDMKSVLRLEIKIAEVSLHLKSFSFPSPYFKGDTSRMRIYIKIKNHSVALSFGSKIELIAPCSGKQQKEKP